MYEGFHGKTDKLVKTHHVKDGRRGITRKRGRKRIDRLKKG